MLRIITQRPEAEAELKRISDRLQDDQAVYKEATVAEILQNVKRKGDQALLSYTAEYDKVEMFPSELRVTGAELDTAFQQIDPELLKAITTAHDRITSFHKLRIPESWASFGDKGIILGKRYTPVDRAGIYIPGGRASYPSTVLMNAVPARVAGVKRLVMVTPPRPDKSVDRAILVSAQLAGVEEIYRVGGAQAIAALAYGTETIPRVDVITGPGNIYVTLAKKQVYGRVGIDSLAGPSEVLIIADVTANPLFVAQDLLAQAEHDPIAAAILLTTDLELAQRVGEEISRLLVTHPRRELTEKSIANYGVAIVVSDLSEACELSNLFAPEHLELEVEDPWKILEHIRHAGAIFMGHHTPEAVGDYLAGPNHTLPTCSAARFSSALSVETFLKSSSIIQYSKEALSEANHTIQLLTQAEGLVSHGESVQVRLDLANDSKSDR